MKNDADDLMPYPCTSAMMLDWVRPLTQPTMQNTTCGTVSRDFSPPNNVVTATNADLNDSTSNFVQIGGWWPNAPAHTPYVSPLSYTYYTSDPRVSELETKVEMLEKMLAAVLSGRDIPKPRRKRTR